MLELGRFSFDTGEVGVVQVGDEAPADGSAFGRHDMGVTPFWTEATPEQRQAQREWQRVLTGRGDVRLGDEVFVSRLAVVYTDRLTLGPRTYVSAHAYLWGDVELGSDCTLNPFSEVRGRVKAGDGVRVGAHTSILGFNHSMAINRPIHEQPLTYRGIVIGDDVWIGSHVVILDGVSIGSHSVIGAGSVVTKDVAPWTVVVGNPARPIRDRRSPAPVPPDLDARLGHFGQTVRAQLPGIVARCWDEDAESFVDHPGHRPTIRAWCDAVELAVLADGTGSLPVPPDQVVETLRDRQSEATGLVPEWSSDDVELSVDGHAAVDYHVLSVGYALHLLGATWRYPVHAVAALSPAALRDALDHLGWRIAGWQAGSWVDTVGTAMHWNRKDFGLPTELETLFGWLLTRCDPATGLWGGPDPATGWLEPVNGFYRLTRGTFAQFGIPLPYPQRTVDSVLAHASDQTYFTDRRGTACNVLDVIHPLWLAARQTNHRRRDGEEWARRQLDRALNAWQPGRGYSFTLEDATGWQNVPGLLGTEMWLSIVWLLADLLGASDALGYRPRGIHRPESADRLNGVR